MMSKIFKYISVFSLWLAVIIMSAHMIIPHDHHIADSFSNHEENCTASNNNSRHHTSFPVHCHAFNDLVSEKPIIYFIIKDIQCDDFIVGSFSVSSNHLLQFTILSFFNSKESLVDSEILELSALRAPPSLI
jgi:hypothetical protein